MGILSRLSNILTGKANKALDKMEDPIEQIDLAIRKREEAIDKAKMSSSQFLGSLTTKRNEVIELKKKITDYDGAVKKAVQGGDTEKAKQFLAKKLDYDRQLVEAESTVANLEEKAKKIKDNIQSFDKEIDKLRLKKTELNARFSSAKAQAQVNELLADVNKDSNISIDDIERKVTEKEEYANGLETFKKEDLDSEVKNYSAETNIDDELAKYMQ